MGKVALIIGHNKRSRGAGSMIIGTEYAYWENIAYKIKEQIPEKVDVYERFPNKNYIAEMNELLKDLNSKEYDYCFELHFNSATETANGAETIIYPGNKRTKLISEKFLKAIKDRFNIRTRRIIESPSSKDRGGYGIYKAKHNYILLEPFFGSNVDESFKFSIVGDVVDFFVEFIKDNL